MEFFPPTVINISVVCSNTKCYNVSFQGVMFHRHVWNKNHPGFKKGKNIEPSFNSSAFVS